MAQCAYSDSKMLIWRMQIPGMLVTTAADGFNVFKPSNVHDGLTDAEVICGQMHVCCVVRMACA
jgi:hypothetical protein